MFRSAVIRLLWFVVMFPPSTGFGQSSDRMIPHPALGAEAMHPTHQLGKFGEWFVRANLRASGFEVYDANLNDRGIDLLAVRRDAQGALVEVRPVEVKTRSRGAEARLDMTRDGRQLSAEWTDKRLARLAQEHPDSRLRQLASEVLSLKETHPERIRPSFTASRSGRTPIASSGSMRSRGPSRAW
jgi:hypothetical protein